MIFIKTISPKRQALIDAKNNAPFEVGERIGVPENLVSEYSRKTSPEACKILEVFEDELSVIVDGKSGYKPVKIKKTEVANRDIRRVGANPFPSRRDTARAVNFHLDSVIHTLNLFNDKERVGGIYKVGGIEVKDCNWNPFVYNRNGEKEYYQRPFVWSVADKQLLIESIYQGIECGRLLVRKRGWSELEQMVAKGETELFWYDIVDGKQRLNAIQGFMLDEFPDSHGNYFSDLSFEAQHRFVNHQLFSYAEMPENTADEDVIYQFLRLNFAGVPQSKEHIEFVRSLQGRV